MPNKPDNHLDLKGIRA